MLHAGAAAAPVLAIPAAASDVHARTAPASLVTAIVHPLLRPPIA
jgi:hypothetical protein